MITRNEETYELMFNPDEDRDELVLTLKEVFENSEVGRLYKRSYYTTESGDIHLEQIIRAARLISGGSNVSKSNLVQALSLLLDAGEIQPKEFAPAAELTEPEPDTRPKDKNGKLLSPQQIQWSEYRQFAETASMAEVNRRKQTDAGFASFVLKNMQREMSQEIDDAVTPLGTSSLPRHDASNELVVFARKYSVEPVANLKPKGGFVTLAGEQLPWSSFQLLLKRATDSHLI
jgi:hypothetical protein